MNADGDMMAKALGNSKAVAERHHLKPTAVLPDCASGTKGWIFRVSAMKCATDVQRSKNENHPQPIEEYGGADETRTRDLCRDRAAQ